MNTRECLYEIPDLKLEGILQRMNLHQLDEYWEKLHAFIDSYPEMESTLKAHLAAKEYKEFFYGLSALRDLLESLHANDMAGEIQAQIIANTKHENIKHDRLVAFMGYFLSTIAMLSIDIQIAEYMAADDNRNKYKYKPATAAGVSDDPQTILAVDDNPVHLNALKAHLKDTVYRLTCLTTGKDVLRFIEKKHPDLFILDIMMPEMDGIELAGRIKAADQEAKIIFLTGESTKETVMKAMKAGGTGFIVKPAAKEYVLAQIAKVI
jgi:CheY-like chemotaxis protein